MVMLVGQYSTGKTTFIKYLLEQDFPGIRIGPEPTTDRYVKLFFKVKRILIIFFNVLSLISFHSFKENVFIPISNIIFSIEMLVVSSLPLDEYLTIKSENLRSRCSTKFLFLLSINDIESF